METYVSLQPPARCFLSLCTAFPRLVSFSLVALLICSVAIGQTVVIPTVVVGTPGNAADKNGFGSVSYLYRIGQTEVRNDQYAAFLNAVAKDDPNGLYDLRMGSSARGGILRGGSPGSYTYNPKPAMTTKPVNFVSWLDAARFANWLHNGQPGGAQGPATTEDGTYDLSLPNAGFDALRKAGANWFLPSRDEWHKAAYFDPVSPQADGSGTPDYWWLATRSDQLPVAAVATVSGDIANPGPNVVNHAAGADWNGQDGNLTSVGSAGFHSASFSGTLDQGGNALEWTEEVSQVHYRVRRGGSYDTAGIYLRSGWGFLSSPDYTAAAEGFRVAAAVPGQEKSLVVYPGEQGIELYRLDQGQSVLVHYAGGGPTLPMPQDVDAILTPDERYAIYPTGNGFEVLDLGSNTMLWIAFDGPGPANPLTPGVDVVVTKSGDQALFPTPAGIEVLDLGAMVSQLVPFATGPIQLRGDVDVAITEDSSTAIYPTPTGFARFDLQGLVSNHLFYAGPGPQLPQQVAVDVVLTRDSRHAIYNTHRGFEFLNLETQGAEFVPYASGTLATLPIDVDMHVVRVTASSFRATYVTPLGIEVVDVPARTTRLATFSGPLSGTPLPNSIDAPVTPDGVNAVYVTPFGFEDVNLISATSVFTPYATGQMPGLTEGVDVLIASSGRHAILPTPNGFQVLERDGNNSKFYPYDGPGVTGLMPRAVDVVLSADQRFAVYVTQSGFEILDVLVGVTVFVPFAGPGPGGAIPEDVDPILLADHRTLVYPVTGGYEELDLSSFTATFTPYQGLGPSPLPVGVDVFAATHVGGGQPPYVQAFSNDDPADEDFLLKPHHSLRQTARLGVEVQFFLPHDIVESIQALDPAGVTFVEAPSGVAGMDGLVNQPLAASNLSLDQTTGTISGTPLQAVRRLFLLYARGTFGRTLAEVWIDHRVVPRFEWDHRWPKGMFAQEPLPDHIVTELHRLAPAGVRFEGAPAGILLGVWETCTFADAGLQLNPLTGTISGTPRVAGHKHILADVFDRQDGGWIADIEIEHWVDEPPFVRGDCNSDGSVDLSDALTALSFSFTGGAKPVCLDACDFPGSGVLDITNAVYLMNRLFLGGPAVPPPNACGTTLAVLGCEEPTGTCGK